MRELGPIDWPRWSTRFLLFTGRGGVGKTTIAFAVAVTVADRGRRVLLVSTDPPSNLSDVLEMTTGERQIGVPGAPRVENVNLDRRRPPTTSSTSRRALTGRATGR